MKRDIRKAIKAHKPDGINKRVKQVMDFRLFIEIQGPIYLWSQSEKSVVTLCRAILRCDVDGVRRIFFEDIYRNELVPPNEYTKMRQEVRTKLITFMENQLNKKVLLAPTSGGERIEQKFKKVEWSLT
jgi:P2-related tail formation protein